MKNKVSDMDKKSAKSNTREEIRAEAPPRTPARRQPVSKNANSGKR